MEIVLAVLIGLAIPIMGIAGFFMALNLKSRVALLEGKLAAFEAAGGAFPVTVTVPEAPPETAPEPVAEEVLEPVIETYEPVAGPVGPSTVPPIAAAPVAPPVHGPGLEERLGTRWAVWVGGVALALGGIFLVRYSIEQGLLGPGARIAAGALFALALMGAGEWMRRRERSAFQVPGIPSAHVPSVLTAAGTLTAFATAYAAYSLYDLIGPAVAFVLLGAIALLTLAAAALHGPALAAIGLAASLGSPLLIDSGNPQVWPVALYLAVVVAASYALARLRLWKPLAMAASAGGLLWAVLFLMIEDGSVPVMAHVVVQTLLAGAFLVADPHRHRRDADAHPDLFAGAVLLGFAALAVVVVGSAGIGPSRPIFSGLLVAVLLGLAVRFAPAASSAGSAALVAAGTLLLWPVARQIQAEPVLVLPPLFGEPATPSTVATFLAFAVLSALALLAGGLRRLGTGRELRPSLAAWYAGAATAGPLAVLIVSYWRVTGLVRDIPFALAAAALGIVFVGAAAWLRRREGETMDAVRFGTGAAASAAVAALALGLTFALDKGMLTVAFALAALGTAWVARKVGIFELRYAVAAIGAIVLARLAWDPTIVQGHPGSLYLVNWVLWGYGVPAVAFFLAGRLLSGFGRDRVVELVESLALVFAALLVFFEIRHALNGGNILARRTDHLEMGLIATASLAFAIVLVRVRGLFGERLSAVASLIFKAASFAVVLFGLVLIHNPWLSGEAILGGAVFNSLLPSYLLPAGLAALLAYYEAPRRSPVHVRATAALALLLQLLYVALEIRRLFQGPIVSADLPTGQAEQWSYSVALLVLGIALLALGFVRNSRFLRLGSAAYIGLAVLKVFIFDLSNLEGVTRALSFIGLGLVLVGIALAYQKLLARRLPPPAPPQPA